MIPYKWIATTAIQIGRLLFGWWRTIKREKEQIQAQANLERVLKVGDTMAEILALLPSAKRVFLLRTNDNGRDMAPGVDWFGTITDEVYDRNVKPSKPNFQKILLDNDYKEKVVKIGREGVMYIAKRDVNPNTLIEGVFEHDNVELAIVHKILYLKKRQFLLVVQFDSEKIKELPQRLYLLKSRVDRIRGLMEQD